MNTNTIEKKFKLLPDNLQSEVLDFVDFLLTKKTNLNTDNNKNNDTENACGILQASHSVSLEQINAVIKQRGGHL